MNRKWTIGLVCVLSLYLPLTSCSQQGRPEQPHELKPTGVPESTLDLGNSTSRLNDPNEQVSEVPFAANLDPNEVANGMHTRKLLEENQMDLIVKSMPPTRGYFYENDPLTATVRWGTVNQIMFMLSKGYRFVSSGDNDDPGHSVYEVAVEKNDVELMRLLLDSFGVPKNDILTVLFKKSIDLDRVSIVKLILEREPWKAAIIHKDTTFLADGGGSVEDRNVEQPQDNRVAYVEMNGSAEMKALFPAGR